MSGNNGGAGGRPSSYSIDVANEICNLLATHTISMKRICALYDHIPDESTIRRWRLHNIEFRLQYLEAKRQQSDLMIEEIDDLINEVSYYRDHEGNERIDAPSVAIATARANNRKWMASRLMPKLYGERQQTEVTVKHEDDLKSLA